MAERLTLDIALLLLVGCCALLIVDVFRHSDQWAARIDWLVRFPGIDEQPSRHPSWRLWLVSFAGLFTEVMMIRWIGTEVRIFAYFQNLALIACFLGFGLGCYWAHRKQSVLLSILCMAFLIAVIEVPLKVLKLSLEGLSGMLAFSSDADLWVSPLIASAPGKETVALFVLSAVILLIALLLPLAAIMIPLGQMVGYYLDSASNAVHAYSLNLMGSVAGIWAFAALAFLRLPPEYWFGLAFLVLLSFVPKFSRAFVTGLALLAVSLAMFRLGGGNHQQVFGHPIRSSRWSTKEIGITRCR